MVALDARLRVLPGLNVLVTRHYLAFRHRGAFTLCLVPSRSRSSLLVARQRPDFVEEPTANGNVILVLPGAAFPGRTTLMMIPPEPRRTPSESSTDIAQQRFVEGSLRACHLDGLTARCLVDHGEKFFDGFQKWRAFRYGRRLGRDELLLLILASA